MILLFIVNFADSTRAYIVSRLNASGTELSFDNTDSVSFGYPNIKQSLSLTVPHTHHVVLRGTTQCLLYQLKHQLVSEAQRDIIEHVLELNLFYFLLINS